jgi:hypothetical protein
MRFALGLFHFNPHWNLDLRSAHRHCSESLWPLLRCLCAHKSWRITLEISGSGLEFVRSTYPGCFRALSRLVEEERIELVWSLYTPAIWVAFPRRDLIKSIELNQRCISNTGFPWSRTFFAQEGFFGAGVGRLKEYFDIAICKDDLLRYYFDFDCSIPCFNLNGIHVVVASGHLLNELSATLQCEPGVVKRSGVLESHLEFLRAGQRLRIPDNAPSSRGSLGGLQWLWYHCGDGNHFGTMYRPDDLEHCYFDQAWSNFIERQMQSYEEHGYALSTVREFAKALPLDALRRQAPPLIEGGWNPWESDGLLRWMGRNSSPWEDDCAVLTAAARARARLLAAERSMDAVPEPERPAAVARLEEAWKSLLHAQISDALGWRAGQAAVQTSLQNSERTFVIANQLLASVDCNEPQFKSDADALLHDRADSPIDEGRAWPAPVLFGAEGTGGYTTATAVLKIYDCRFTATSEYCGVRLPFGSADIIYCPSGMEETPASIPVSVFRRDMVTLPLANGLVYLGDGWFVIKSTFHFHLAATVNFRKRTLEFAVHGARPGRLYHWRFYVFFGSLNEAVAVANRLNSM